MPSEPLGPRGRRSRRFQEGPAHRAGDDPLTDLANRRLRLGRFSQAASPLDRRSGPIAVLPVDLDGFKAVNDRLGRETGDRLLGDVGAHRPRRDHGSADGNRLTIVLPTAARATAKTTEARVIEQFRRPCRLDGPAVVVAAGIGIALAEGG